MKKYPHRSPSFVEGRCRRIELHLDLTYSESVDAISLRRGDEAYNTVDAVGRCDLSAYPTSDPGMMVVAMKIL